MPPVCVKCEIEMRPKKNAVMLEVMTDERPYQVYSADLWECVECHAEVVVGVARNPRLEWWEDGYQQKLKGIIATERTIQIRCWPSTAVKQQYQTNQTKQKDKQTNATDV